MNNLAWALKVPLLTAALLCAGLGIYCTTRSHIVLYHAHHESREPLMQLTIWLARRLHGEEAAKRRWQQLRERSASADWACRVAFVGGALGVTGAVLFVRLVSSGTYFPIGLSWSNALRRGMNGILPSWVMGYLGWRVGHRMADNVAFGEAEAPHRAQVRIPLKTYASQWCFLAGLGFMDGMLIVLRWIAFAIASLGII